ncbi:MAG: HAD-IA family hydrolase [Vulcanimicrobiota bacterium]
MYKGIIFDLYDTLIYMDWEKFNNYRQRFANLIDRPLEVIEDIWKKYRPKRFTGEIPTLTAMLELLLSELKLEKKDFNIRELEKLEIEALTESFHPYPGVAEMLDELKEKGFILALLSNTSASSEELVANLPWLDKFDHVFLSHKTGFMKPQPQIFEMSTEKMGITTAETIFVGDGGFDELAGANEAGLATVKIIQKYQHPSFRRSRFFDYSVDSIEALTPKILEINRGDERPELDRVEINKLEDRLKKKDKFTWEHCRRVSRLIERFAENLDFNENEIRELKIAGLLHDLGKLDVPEEIYEKIATGEALTPKERKRVRKHAGHTKYLDKYKNLSRNIGDVLKYHHERYDGTGYPHGLIGDEIPRGVRMLSIADYYDTIINPRPWQVPEKQKPLNREDAIKILIEKSHTRFDPELVVKFIDLVLKNNTLVK